MRGRIAAAAAALLALGAGACATGPVKLNIASVKAEDANFSPRRVFLLSQIVTLSGQGPYERRFHKAFAARLAADLAGCGVDVQGFEDVGLRLDDKEIVKAVEASGADTVMKVWFDGGLFYNGVLKYRAIHTTLFQAPPAAPGALPGDLRPVWKSLVNYGGPASPLVDNLTGQMMDDGFFRGCMKPDPSAAEPAVGGRLTAVAYAPSSALRAGGSLSIAQVAYAPAVEAAAAANDSKRPASGYNSTSAAMVPPWVKEEKKPVTSSGPAGAGGGAVYSPHPQNSAHLLQPWDKVTPAKARRAPTDGHATNPAASMPVQPWETKPEEAASLDVDARQLTEEGIYRTRLDVDVSEYLGKGLAAELGAMGIETSDARRELWVNVEDFALEMSGGFGFGSTLKVRYELKEAATGKVLFSAVKVTSVPRDARPITVPKALDLALRLNVEALVKDGSFAAAIR